VDNLAKPLIQKLPLAGGSSFVARTYRTPYFETPWHQHVEYELLLTNGSTGPAFIGDFVGEYRPGEVYLLGPNLPHWFRKKEDRMVGSAIVVHFREDFWGSSFLALPEMQAVRQLLQTSIRGIRLKGALNERVAALLREVETRQGLSQLRQLLACLDEMSQREEYDLLATSLQPYPARPDGEKINQVLEYTLTHYKRKITVAEVAHLVSLSESAFSHYFKRATKKRYTDFVNEIRVGHACRLLAETPLSVLEVCYESGFHNWANFSKQFKAIKHRSPSQYRKLFRA
jgi:AraC-like DNA-binding protein